MGEWGFSYQLNISAKFIFNMLMIIVSMPLKSYDPFYYDECLGKVTVCIISN